MEPDAGTLGDAGMGVEDTGTSAGDAGSAADASGDVHGDIVRLDSSFGVGMRGACGCRTVNRGSRPPALAIGVVLAIAAIGRRRKR